MIIVMMAITKKTKNNILPDVQNQNGVKLLVIQIGKNIKVAITLHIVFDGKLL
jgi:hypothetical protein